MTSRFHFPEPVSGPAFVPVPFGVFAGMPAYQLAFIQHVYQLAWERTQAVLAPTRVEQLYRVCVN